MSLAFTTDKYLARSRHRMAADFCDSCPVRRECAEASVEEPYGVWGGQVRAGGRRAGVVRLVSELSDETRTSSDGNIHRQREGNR
jgi:hypothetical protein